MHSNNLLARAILLGGQRLGFVPLSLASFNSFDHKNNSLKEHAWKSAWKLSIAKVPYHHGKSPARVEKAPTGNVLLKKFLILWKRPRFVGKVQENRGNVPKVPGWKVLKIPVNILIFVHIAYISYVFISPVKSIQL